MKKILIIALILLLALPFAAFSQTTSNLSGTTGKVGQEDIYYGTGESNDTFTVPTYSSGTITLTKVPNPNPGNYSKTKGLWSVSNSAAIVDHGVASGVDYTAGNLKKIIDLIGANTEAIYVPGNATYVVGTNLTIPANVKLILEEGAILSPSLGVTLKFSGAGSIQAGYHQIFAGTGNLVFAAGTELRSSWFADITTAISKIGAAAVHLLATGGSNVLTGNTTFPATLAVTVTPGSYITKASTYTLTINGPFNAPESQVFSGFSTGNVTGLKKALPEWWGATPSPSYSNSFDNLAYIQCALDSVKAQAGRVCLSWGYYYVSGKITLDGMGVRGLILEGLGAYATKITTDYNGRLFAIGEAGVAQYGLVVQNIGFVGPKVNGGAYNNSVGIYMKWLQHPSSISNIQVQGFHQGILVADFCSMSTWDRVWANTNDIGVDFYGQNSDPIHVTKSRFYYNRTAQVRISSTRVTLDDCYFAVGEVAIDELGVLVALQNAVSGSGSQIINSFFEGGAQTSTGGFIQVGDGTGKVTNFRVKNNHFANSAIDVISSAIEFKSVNSDIDISGNHYINFRSKNPIKFSIAPYSGTSYSSVRHDENESSSVPLLSDADLGEIIYPVPSVDAAAYSSLRTAADNVGVLGTATYDIDGTPTPPIHTLTVTSPSAEAGYYFEFVAGTRGKSDGKIWEIIFEFAQYAAVAGSNHDPLKRVVVTVYDVTSGGYLHRNLIVPIATYFRQYRLRTIMPSNHRVIIEIDLYNGDGSTGGSIVWKDPVFRKVNTY